MDWYASLWIVAVIVLAALGDVLHARHLARVEAREARDAERAELRRRLDRWV